VGTPAAKALHEPRGHLLYHACSAPSPAQLIPEEFEFDSNNDNSWISSLDRTTEIKLGTHVRVRIVGVKYDPAEVVSAPPRGCAVDSLFVRA
jgi:hypothetical protein